MKLFKKILMIVAIASVLVSCNNIKSLKGKEEATAKQGKQNNVDGVYDGGEWLVHYNPEVLEIDNQKSARFIDKENKNNYVEVNCQKNKTTDSVMVELINEIVLDDGNNPSIEIQHMPIRTNKGEHDAFYAVNSNVENGKGEYRQILAFNYNDMVFSFLFKQDMVGDETLDMKISDAFSNIIDSLEIK